MPMSEAWIAFSMALMAFLSYGETTSSRGSGTDMFAIVLSGT
jgi:hypothetical protein